MVAAAEVAPGDLVVDIGAGAGALTRPLLAAGARVVAVELHPRRAAELRRHFAAADCRVVELDIVRFTLPACRFRVVANPPFAVLAQLLRKLTTSGSRLQRADVVVPLHVAGRWARGAGVGAARFDARVVRRLPPDAFVPPAQPAAVLRLEPRRSGPRSPGRGHT